MTSHPQRNPLRSALANPWLPLAAILARFLLASGCSFEEWLESVSRAWSGT